jgi:hypothetical protein
MNTLTTNNDISKMHQNHARLTKDIDGAVFQLFCCNENLMTVMMRLKKKYMLLKARICLY